MRNDYWVGGVFWALTFVAFLTLGVVAEQRQQPLTRQPLLATNEAALDAIGKMNQEAIQPAVRRCLEQELTPVYAVNPEQIVAQHSRVTAEAFKIIVCVEAK
jgi:hypothetical protein